jgi:hypothetical protein
VELDDYYEYVKNILNSNVFLTFKDFKNIFDKDGIFLNDKKVSEAFEKINEEKINE